MPSFSKPKISGYTFQGMLTSSKNMRLFFELVSRVAATESAILIRGESGTGKELVARAIHSISQRAKRPYHTVNCAMLTPELINSELFGHVRGSFTGANTDHKGFFEASHRGTLFLDEVAELPIVAQSRLLRAIQEKTVTKVGSTKTTPVDVRILSATHKALRRETKAGTFREDLMYRLRVVPIYLPKLTERGRDIELLTWLFIDEFNQRQGRIVNKIDNLVRDALLSYHWPGNIRELRNNIEYAYAVGQGPCIKINELTPELRGEDPVGDQADAEPSQPIYRQQERRKIVEALNHAKGNRGEAAKALGMSRSTLWRKVKEFRIVL